MTQRLAYTADRTLPRKNALAAAMSCILAQASIDQRTGAGRWRGRDRPSGPGPADTPPGPSSPHRLIAEDDAAEEEHLTQVPQAACNRAPETTRAMTSEGNRARFRTPPLRSLNCLPQARQRNRGTRAVRSGRSATAAEPRAHRMVRDPPGCQLSCQPSRADSAPGPLEPILARGSNFSDRSCSSGNPRARESGRWPNEPR